MDNGNILAGLDSGHVNTKAILMRGKEILGYTTIPTGFDIVSSAQTALNYALENAEVTHGELAKVAATGIFRDIVEVPPLNVNRTVPDYTADAKGALFLNQNSRTVIDIGGNIHKAVHYDQHGNLLDVIQNDKCADGLGIFYTTMAKALGVSEQELSELALRSTKHVSVAIHCAASAESEAIDLICQGVDIEDVADAISRFIAERVAAMCTYLPMAKEIVAVGSLAKSKALINHLSILLNQDVSSLDLPEYAGAIGAAVTNNEGLLVENE